MPWSQFDFLFQRRLYSKGHTPWAKMDCICITSFTSFLILQILFHTESCYWCDSNRDKVLNIFKNVRILAYQKRTFHKHQRYLLIPSIIGSWRKYQSKILERLREKEVILAGDGKSGRKHSGDGIPWPFPFFFQQEWS